MKTVFRDVALCSLIDVYCLHHKALMMEAVSTSETPVNFYETTRSNIPADIRLLCVIAV
jgi:hypothetical protein